MKLVLIFVSMFCFYYFTVIQENNNDLYFVIYGTNVATFSSLQQFLLTNLSYNTMYEVKVRGGTYSRFFSENNKTYKGPFSHPRKILLYPDCHMRPHPEQGTGFEMSAGIIAGIICATFALFLLVVAMIIWRQVHKRQKQ